MRKRRVGVTAKSRRIAGKQATGSLQIDTEMAAPLCINNTNGHRGEDRKSADGSMATVAQASQSAEDDPKQWRQHGKWSRVAGGEERRATARMRRCLILRQGASPLRPLAPFPRCWMIPNGENLSRVRKPRKKRAP